MKINDIIEIVESGKNCIVDDKYNIHTIKKHTRVSQKLGGKNYSFYFKKMENESDEIDFYDINNQTSDYVVVIRFSEISKQDNIEFYLERFKKARKRHIIYDSDKTPAYTQYS